MSVGDEKEQRFYFLPCREEEKEEEEEERRASGAHNSRCKPAAGERQCPISASGFSPVCFFKCAFLDLLDFLDLNQVALCALVQFLSSVNGEACRERGRRERTRVGAGLQLGWLFSSVFLLIVLS